MENEKPQQEVDTLKEDVIQLTKVVSAFMHHYSIKTGNSSYPAAQIREDIKNAATSLNLKKEGIYQI